MKNMLLGAVAAAALITSSAAQASDREPSNYLKCDGEPNNITGGEQFARFLGAITLLGIFAPSPETPDPEARLFGDEGVAACSALIDDPDEGEGNAVRRIPLILARALHQIEAENYAAALVDVEMARTEAAAAGLAGDPYFDRSMGLSFNRIEAHTHLRMGNAELARDVSVQSIAEMRYSFLPNALTPDFTPFLKDFSPEEEARYITQSKIRPAYLYTYASRLMEAGRFAEAAEKSEAYIAFYDNIKEEDEIDSWVYAHAAYAHALAGNWDKANEHAAFARSNIDARRANGKPEAGAPTSIEVLDFYEVLKLAHEGDLRLARRLYTGRSEWSAVSFGAVLYATDLLREGAEEDDLIGTLAKPGEELWQQRYDERLAVLRQSDTDNDTLFNNIVPYAEIDQFEDRARNTHRVEKSRIMSDEPTESGAWSLIARGNPQSAIDSIVLHAALQARHQGKEGFMMSILLPSRELGWASIGFARFHDRSDPEVTEDRFILAQDVIDELQQIIPTRDEVRARKRERRRNR